MILALSQSGACQSMETEKNVPTSTASRLTLTFLYLSQSSTCNECVTLYLINIRHGHGSDALSISRSLL